MRSERSEAGLGAYCKRCGRKAIDYTGICAECKDILIKESFDKYDKYLEKQKQERLNRAG
jgi:uncharacterized OB-fold protein